MHIAPPLACLVLVSVSLAQSPNWSQVQTTNAPSARWQQAMAYENVFGRTVLFGGRDASSTYLNDTWEYNGTNWTQLSPTTSPPVRFLSEMVYDSKRLQGVLFGGLSNGSYIGDTWIWDSIKKDWSQALPTNNPVGRYNPALAYDPARGVVVLFGGRGQTAYLNDTWEWDGSNWTQIQTTNSPSARYTAMAYDAGRQRVVLYGGSNNGKDTWEYDGKTWTQIQTTNTPNAYCCVAMAYDPLRQRIVVFGGFSPNNNETWEYDGQNWTQINPTTSPPARRDFDNMVYDATRQRMVLFGGLGTAVMNDTWEYTAAATLTASPATISIATGGAQNFTLAAGATHRRRLYWLFGSVTGTSPGVTLASLAGTVNLPLNPDPYTDLTIAFANSAFLTTTKGTLSNFGGATAALNVPVINQASAVGLRLHHAYLVYDAGNNFYMASNPVMLQLTK